MHKLVAQDRAVFEDAAEEAGLGQLPTLLRQLVSNVTPTLGIPKLTPTAIDIGTVPGSSGENSAWGAHEDGAHYIFEKRVC